MLYTIPPETVSTLAIACIYCFWLRLYLYQRKQQAKLRERVAYMLWCAASEAD